jgi:voltage-dependent potassium channel beta subunit
MQYRRLGDAGMKVSAVSLGGWINFGKSRMPGESAQEIVKAAYDSGINFYDHADIYALGEAEEQMGSILKQFPRHSLVISTKVFQRMSPEINDAGLSRKHILESIDKSLRRLGTDYIDIYFCHRPDPETPILETARAMNDLIHQGKVMYWGTSEWSAAQLVEAHAVCERYNLFHPKTEQPEYSLLHRLRVENEILPVTEPRGIGLVVWSPLAQGMLTGKYDEGIPENSRFAKHEWGRERFMQTDIAQRVRDLKAVADDLGLTRSQLALAWVLRQPGVSCVITGATNVTQVQENVKAAETTLPDSALARLDDLFNGE